jgi:light-regulated signal transduction histidine kinase (bacteriophytochrome)
MISGYVQLLKRRYKGKLDDEADEFINFAVDGATRMQRLINDLLKYSRVNTKGKEPEEINTEEVLGRVLTDLGMMIEDSGAKVEHNELPLVKADDMQLGQVFQNLVSNALKFHGEDPPEVLVNAEKQGTEWLFKVKDNGVGMDPKFQERAFMIFQREDPHGETLGTGIGLAVVKRIIERHKGKIWFDSEPGKGTTFYFTIPDIISTQEEGNT